MSYLEESQTLRRFIENGGEEFNPQLASFQGIHPAIKEPCDIFYKGIKYQITHGNRKFFGDIKRTISKQGKDSRIVGHPSTIDYVKEILETALKEKKNKSDGKTTLLIEPAYVSYWFFKEENGVFEKYFKDNEQELSGLWQNIFIVFSDINIKLR